MPSPPPAQAATDSLATVSSAVTGLDFGVGRYRIQGLPPGQYEVMVQQILGPATGGSGIGPLQFQLTLPIVEEYFRKGRTSNIVSDFTPVRVEAGRLTRGVDLEINGLNNVDPEHVKEILITTRSRRRRISARCRRVSGTASTEDDFTLAALGEGIPDLYKFTTAGPRSVVWISLEPEDVDDEAVAPGDLDLFLISRAPNGALWRLQFSATPTNHELLGVRFPRDVVRRRRRVRRQRPLPAPRHAERPMTHSITLGGWRRAQPPTALLLAS